MNMNLVELFKDFHKLTKDVHSTENALELVKQEYGIDNEEIVDLYQILHDLVCQKFEIRKLKRRHQKQVEATIELMIETFFYGMHVARDECWNWHDIKKNHPSSNS